MNKIGVYYAYWEKNWDANVTQYIDKAADLGFDVLEISSTIVVDLNKLELEELKQRAKDVGIEITYCIGLPPEYDLASIDPKVRKNGIRYALKTLKSIRYAGGKILSGINYSCWPCIPDQGIEDKGKYLEYSKNSLKEILKAAEDYDITYCLEVVNRFEQFLINTAQEGVEFVKQLNSPKAKVLLDTFHMNIEEDSFYDAITTAGEYLGHLHIGESNRKPPGVGRIPWAEIAQGLRDIGYQERIVMEPFVKMGGEVGRDIRVWRDISEGKSIKECDQEIVNSLSFIRSII